MRQINVDFLDIESFLGQPEPYAILSHRWGPGVEVKFEDYASVKDKIKEQITKPQVDDPSFQQNSQGASPMPQSQALLSLDRHMLYRQAKDL